MAEVIVIGGGPSGMMAAISAANENNVTLIEKNEKLGKKLYITGKGRCNLTNSKDISDFFNYIPCNSNFLYSSLYGFTNEDVMKFFSERGVALKVERGDRVFPESDKSSDIIKALNSELSNKNVKVLLNTKVTEVIFEENVIKGIKYNDTILKGDYFIFCTGGLSYSQTGSTGDGYIFSQKLGHSIKKPIGSIVPMEVNEEWVKELQGLSLKNIILTLINSEKEVVFEEMGELLFTHFGISGPLVLTASSIKEDKNGLTGVINLKPALSSQDLDKRIQRDFLKNSNKILKNALDELLPRKMIEVFIKLTNIDGDKKVNEITKNERANIVYLLQNMELTIKGLRPIEEAIITRGGINLKEIDSSTLKSKIIDNLYFAGEILDVDGVTGGFNLQIAFSTGFLAGRLGN